MRVTDKMMFDGASTRSGQARSDVEKAMNELSSGLRVAHPWDDPAAAGLLVSGKAEVRREKTFEDTSQRAYDELAAMDNALDGVTTILNRARQLGVQLGSDTYSAEERAGAAAEIGGLFQQAIAHLNTKVADRYIFAGNLDRTPPFDPAGAYQGDTGVRQVEVAPGVYETASIRADVTIKGVGGGVDLLGTLTSLQNALAANDGNSVRNMVGSLDSALNQLLQSRAQVGASMNIFETATGTARLLQDNTKVRNSHLEDVDLTDSASRLAMAQRALDAALTASAKGFQMSLLDKLG